MNLNWRSLTTTVLLLIIPVAGCCSRPCGWASNWRGIGNTRVAPPGTFSYQTTASQPYYTPPSTGINPGNPNNAIVPGQNPGASNPSQWRAVDGSQNGSSFYGPVGAPPAAGQNPTSYQVAGPENRSAYVEQNYDPTRLQATDAMSIRAPANFAHYGNVQAMTPNVIMIPGSLQIPGSVVYPAAPNMTARANSAIGYPTIGAQPNGSVVLAESRSNATAASPNYRVGWRDSRSGGQSSVR